MPGRKITPDDLQATTLHGRASSLAGLRDSVGHAIGAIKAALTAIEAISTTVTQMKDLATSAKSAADVAERSRLAARFDALLAEMTRIVQGVSFQGTNLIGPTAGTLTVNFGEDNTHRLVIVGMRLDGTGLALAEAANNWETDSDIDMVAASLNEAFLTLRSSAQTLGSNVSLLNVRLDFAHELINTLEEGAAKLVNADMSEEAANLLALQTRQQLGTTSLSLAQQSGSSVLSLFWRGNEEAAGHHHDRDRTA